MMVDLSDLRQSYLMGGLAEADLPSDPFALFEAWFSQIKSAGPIEPNAMCLSTVDASGAPDSRMVLLKKITLDGFTFYTNTESTKAAELQQNGNAALLFYWPELERQVRIRGNVELVSPSEADAYFASRPRGHQLGAWASHQSQPVASREDLERNLQEITQRFPEQPLSRPPFWGGFRLKPRTFEFWQGRPNRLHDRIQYSFQEGLWIWQRLQP